MPGTQIDNLDGRRLCIMSIIWLSDIQFSQILDYITLCISIKNIRYFCISVIHSVINLGVSSMNIYHEYKIICTFEEKMVGILSQEVNHEVPSSNPMISNLVLYLIVYRN